MTPDLTALLQAHAEAARKATPGPWASSRSRVAVSVFADIRGYGVFSRAHAWKAGDLDAAHIAANDPAVALAFNEVAQAANAMVQSVETFWDSGIIPPPFHSNMTDLDAVRRALANLRLALAKEIP